jgi:hypothetical protein
MDKNDLKSMWQQIHPENANNLLENTSIQKLVRSKHSKIISRVLSDIRLEIRIYLFTLIIFIGLMIYALGYLGLQLSITSLGLFSFVGVFLFIKTISEINRLLVFVKTTDNLSIKESLLVFRKKINRIKRIDFLSYLVYFYALAIWLTYSYIKDIGGVKYLLTGNAFHSFVMLIIFILLLIPWFIKYQHNQRYKHLFFSLYDSERFLYED